ncbi:ribulose-phosphate 3-epimerase [Brassicibacter mesophilus]|uniref:ribulose-phosphate 3-epimerase n=1 Tax=Brassicibacter mesophilus TaxID=745119 RepID=UPI003D2292A0
MKIIPSIASANQVNLQNEVKRLGMCYDNLHIDIEDGNFIENITFGFKTIQDLRSICEKKFSVHLMVNEPKHYITKLAALNCSHIFVHVENIIYLRELINLIKSFDIKAGIALNPISKVYEYKYIFKDIDAVLFMTSEPDNEEQCFNEEILENIIDFKSYKHIELWADGGIKLEHLSKLEKKQIDYVVMGRELFRSHKPDEILKTNNK